MRAGTNMNASHWVPASASGSLSVPTETLLVCLVTGVLAGVCGSLDSRETVEVLSSGISRSFSSESSSVLDPGEKETFRRVGAESSNVSAFPNVTP